MRIIMLYIHNWPPVTKVLYIPAQSAHSHRMPVIVIFRYLIVFSCEILCLNPMLVGSACTQSLLIPSMLNCCVLYAACVYWFFTHSSRWLFV